MAARRGALASAALAALLLIPYGPMLFGGQILLTFDAFVYFYPFIAYRDAALVAGRIPLWASEYFLGAPFLANPQTGVLYPPNWLTIGIEPPAAYAFQAYGHNVLAAIGTLLLARRGLGYGWLPGLTSAAVAGLGGHTLSLIGHLNQLQAAAWAPWILLALGDLWSAPRRRAIARLACLAALQFLAGHAQQVYMTVALAAFWVLLGLIPGALPGTEPRPSVQGRLRQVPGIVASGALAAILALAIVAPQLLATAETAAVGIRADGLTFRDAVAVSLPPWYLWRALLPAAQASLAPPSEWATAPGLAALLLAAVAIGSGARRGFVFPLAAMALVATTLAMGQFTPLYRVLFEVVPGFDLFRVPARWLFLTGFAVALLAGAGVETVRSRAGSIGSLALGGVGLALVFAAGASIPWLTGAAISPVWPGGISILLWSLTIGAIGLLTAMARRWPGPAGTLLVVVVAAELLVGARALDVARVGPAETYVDRRHTIGVLATEAAAHPSGRTLAITDNGWDPGDLAALRASVAGRIDSAWTDDWIATRKYWQTLTPNLGLIAGIPSIDGYDGGVLPLRNYVEVKGLFALTGPNVVDGRLGMQLDRVPATSLLSRFNVRWIIGDRHRDLWADGVYYDLSVVRTLRPGNAVSLPVDHLPLRPDSLGLIARPGGPGATLSIGVRSDAATAQFGWRVGESVAAPRTRTGNTTVEPPIRWQFAPPGQGGLLREIWLEVPATSPPVEIVAISVVDLARGAEWPIPPDPALRVVDLDDIKIYRNDEALPRVRLAERAVRAADATAALRFVTSETDPGAVAVVGLGEEVGTAMGVGRVDTVLNTPESIVLSVTVPDPALLVLAEAWAPGWTATVDGEGVPILVASGGLRAVALGAGEHDVRFDYRPRWLSVGPAATVLALVIAVALFLTGAARRRA